MAGQHAILSPSGASRWLVCTASARLEQQFPDSESEAAKEGTHAHSLGELMILHKLKRVNDKHFKKELATLKKSEYYSKMMHEYCENYSDYVLERYYAIAKDDPCTLIYVEHKLDLGEFVPESFGTADVVIASRELIELIDLKYGKGVRVSAVDNSQLKLYALGVYKDLEIVFNPTYVRATIYQPRLDNVSTVDYHILELSKWTEFLIPKAKQAFNGEGNFAPGEVCLFCRAKAVCRANAEFNLEIAKHELKMPDLLDETEIADILTRSDLFTSWIKAVNDYSLAQALAGVKYRGFKLVEGRAVRTYTDTTAIIKELTEVANFSLEEITEPTKLLPITKLEAEIGKSDFENYVGKFIIKPKGKPTLVLESDKRAEINSTEDIAKDFENVDLENLENNFN